MGEFADRQRAPSDVAPPTSAGWLRQKAAGRRSTVPRPFPSLAQSLALVALVALLAGLFFSVALLGPL
ncbi:MAG: hypothetical protein ACYC5M_01385 [Anaerolineae bacterium]